MKRAGVDLAGELTGFASPFPTAYARRACAPDYAPALPELIDDYLADNPTRNRALDFLPLYAVSDATRGSGQFAYFTVERRPRLPTQTGVNLSRTAGE